MQVPLHLVVVLFLSASAVAQDVDIRDQIPNGHEVPHPCFPGYIWYAPGHKNRDGGGDRNVFGEDFDRNGKVGHCCGRKELGITMWSCHCI